MKMFLDSCVVYFVTCKVYINETLDQDGNLRTASWHCWLGQQCKHSHSCSYYSESPTSSYPHQLTSALLPRAKISARYYQTISYFHLSPYVSCDIPSCRFKLFSRCLFWCVWKGYLGIFFQGTGGWWPVFHWVRYQSLCRKLHLFLTEVQTRYILHRQRRGPVFILINRWSFLGIYSDHPSEGISPSPSLLVLKLILKLWVKTLPSQQFLRESCLDGHDVTK